MTETPPNPRISTALSAPTLIAALLLSTPSTHFSPSPLSLGVNAGDPTGVTVALSFADRLRLQAVGGRSFAKTKLLGAVDLLVSFPDFVNPSSESTRVVFWIGLGARLTAAPRDDDEETSDLGIGFRVPLVVSLFAISDGEAYLEVAPGFTFEPTQRISLDGGLGIRVDVI